MRDVDSRIHGRLNVTHCCVIALKYKLNGFKTFLKRKAVRKVDDKGEMEHLSNLFTAYTGAFTFMLSYCVCVCV